MYQDPFQQYIEQSEPDKKRKSMVWKTAMGLQAVDGLKTSDYLVENAVKNIEGEISIQDAQDLMKSYYEEKPDRGQARTREADSVSVKITKLIYENSFSLSPGEVISIHKELFEDVFDFAGELRQVNLTKKEWVLDRDTVYYADARDLMATLNYDLSIERNFEYAGLSMDECIEHLADFIAKLWQIHPFREGNTRTVAVFLIRYLRTLGFEVENTIFAENAWYFRNALVRSNYTNIPKKINRTNVYLVKFLRNLLLNEENVLSNRELHIDFGEGETDSVREVFDREFEFYKDIKEYYINQFKMF